MLIFFFKLISRLPLSVLHRVAALLGRTAFYLAPSVRERVRRHLQTAALPHDNDMIKKVLSQTAASGLELPAAFFRQPEKLAQLFVETYGWEHLQQAVGQGGLLLLTPHLGSYDLAGRYLSERLDVPLTAMYKPPKIKALDDIMQAGRQRGNGQTATADAAGVRQVMRALRGGEAVVLLPDHVPDPQAGGGVWARFFGRYAYTMTLAARLARTKNVQTLWFVGERLPQGRGFALHIVPFAGCLNGNAAADAETLNRNLETLIRRFPEQYLFAYNRYKHPAGAPLPPQD